MKIHKNTFFFTTLDMSVNGVIPLYLIMKEINGYIGKSNRNKFLMLVSTDESTDTVNMNEEL